MDEKTTREDLLSHLSHDLKNNFISIRAAAGSIKKNALSPEIIETKVLLINQALNEAIMCLDAACASLLKIESDKSGVK